MLRSKFRPDEARMLHHVEQSTVWIALREGHVPGEARLEFSVNTTPVQSRSGQHTSRDTTPCRMTDVTLHTGLYPQTGGGAPVELGVGLLDQTHPDLRGVARPRVDRLPSLHDGFGALRRGQSSATAADRVWHTQDRIWYTQDRM